MVRDGTQAQIDPREAQLRSALAACARGDREALRALYKSEASAMLGVALRILRRRALAEDAVQDAFVKIWRAAKSYDPARGDARPWLFTIVRNRALTMLRDEGRTETSDTVEAPDDAPRESADAIIGRLSASAALRLCLERLDPARRSAVVLAYVHGLSHAELAGRLDMPLGTIKSWVRRSLMALKECLG